MRKEFLWMCVGCLAVAAPVLCAQNTNQHSARNGAPSADHFVSTPGQMVSTPGQMLTGPGQRVSGPGQMVIPPGQAVIPAGSSIAPVPGVVAPFVNSSSASTSAGQPVGTEPSNPQVSPGRREPNPRTYRPDYGAAEYGVVEGHVLPYAIPAAAENRPASAEARSMMAVPGVAAPASPLAAAPSGNRPPYQPDTFGYRKSPPPRDMIVTPEPVLTVVMKDGTRKTMRNYALTPQALIDLDQAASGKEMSIPLSRINMAATEKTASQAGLSFSVPGR